MAGTLGDMIGGNSGADRGAYLDYVEACQLSGGKPLPYAQWIAAGKPTK